MKFRQIAPLLLIAIAPSIPRSTGACSLAPRDGGTWQADEIDNGDIQAPTQVMATYGIDWPEDGSSVACGGSCGPGPGYIVFHPSAIDDIASPEALGYRFVIVGGQPPRGFDPSQVLLVDPYVGVPEIAFSFAAEVHHFTFDVQVTALDRNGNESEPIVLTIDV